VFGKEKIMFTLNQDEMAEFDIERAADFVTFWSQFNDYRITIRGTENPIDYFAELNLGADLTEENARRLLRWKDPHRLTQIILTGPNSGQQNQGVEKALQALPSLNDFRRGAVTEVAIRETVANVFPNGAVFQIFLLHIARPYQYPIADQHVFRAYALHNAQSPTITWDTYTGYRNYFSQIAQTLEIQEVPANMRELKRIDDALNAFGKFLKSYFRQ
jgi:hypothetical protein